MNYYFVGSLMIANAFIFGMCGYVIGFNRGLGWYDKIQARTSGKEG